MTIDRSQLRQILEGALLAFGEPLSIAQMAALFEGGVSPSTQEIREVLLVIQEECQGKGYELKEVASGYRFQVREELGQWVAKLWQEKPQKYSQALLETIALIAYRQPITRGEIEEVRGVSVSSQTIRTLLDREWIAVIGHRDVPGRPALYGTTRQFLDYFNLKSLEGLPSLLEIRNFRQPNVELDFQMDSNESNKPDSGETELETETESKTDDSLQVPME